MLASLAINQKKQDHGAIPALSHQLGEEDGLMERSRNVYDVLWGTEASTAEVPRLTIVINFVDDCGG